MPTAPVPSVNDATNSRRILPSGSTSASCWTISCRNPELRCWTKRVANSDESGVPGALWRSCHSKKRRSRVMNACSSRAAQGYMIFWTCSRPEARGRPTGPSARCSGLWNS
ncbi:hypothetical protein [Streptomyces sp. NPDC059802]|uniref:hypothetical protein n=1 Tax=Streptomyces sp. NPDC059802 TaxID=3346952 RepID=UPI00364D3E7E